MDERTEEFDALMRELMALEATDEDPKSAKRLRELAKRINTLSRSDDTPDVQPLRQAWSEKYIAAFPMPEWAPNKWLPLDYENVVALAKRHQMATDAMAIASLASSLTTALSHWSHQLLADQRDTSEQVERQVADAAAAAEALAGLIEALPEQVRMDLDDGLRDDLPETAIWHFLDRLKDCLLEAAAPYLDGKKWTERLGYLPQTGQGARGTGEAFRKLVEALVRVWEKHAPNQAKNRAWASKGTSGELKFNPGGRFVYDAAALLTRGDAPELTPAVLRKVVRPDPHRKLAEFEKLVRITGRQKKDR